MHFYLYYLILGQCLSDLMSGLTKLYEYLNCGKVRFMYHQKISTPKNERLWAFAPAGDDYAQEAIHNNYWQSVER